MNGRVDESGRALLPVRLRNPVTGVESNCDVWIDTAFTGHLAIPRPQLQTLGLPEGPIITAVLADGCAVELKTYASFLDWFGQSKPIEVIANDGQFPLLGVALLAGHDLHIDYRSGILTLN